MNYYIYGLTSKGNVRENNEDRILVYKDVVSKGSCSTTLSAPFIAAVCDGVGGENAGEVAAQLCLEQLSNIVYSADVDLKREVLNIHHDIKRRGIGESLSVNMQTTLCALAVDENGEAICVNVGDSRMYRFVNAAIRQISTDQSYRQFVYEHGDEGAVSKIAPNLENAIVSSVGSVTNDPEVELIPLVTSFGKEPDDTILIVSDGISDYVTEQQLEIGMGLDLPLSQRLEAIAQLALDNGSVDNLSILGIKPYITKRELENITSENVEKTVNIRDLIRETDELGEILTLDINEIISQPYVRMEPDPLPDKPNKKVQEAEATIIRESAAEQNTENEPQSQNEPDEQITAEEGTVEVIDSETAEEEINEAEVPEAAAEQDTPAFDETPEDDLVRALLNAKAVKDSQRQEHNEPEKPDEKAASDNTADSEDLDLYAIGERALSEVESNAENTTQTIREIEVLGSAMPGHVKGPAEMEREFLERMSKLSLGNIDLDDDIETDNSSDSKSGPELNTVELLHQSASSLAKLENLFGKK